MSADSRSAQKWKGMVIGMDKKEAAQKLMSIFGNVDAIAVLHSVLVGISKYIIIVVANTAVESLFIYDAKNAVIG